MSLSGATHGVSGSLHARPARPARPASAITTALIVDAEGLARIRDEWWDLLGRSFTNEPVLSPPWLETWWEVFGRRDGRRLRVVAIRRDGRLVGLAPLLRRWVLHRHLLPLRRIELLGSGEREEDEILSEYLGILAETGSEPLVVRALAAALPRVGAFDEMVLPNLDGGAPFLHELTAVLVDSGLCVRVEERAQAPYIPLPPSFDEYLSLLSSPERRLVRRAVADLDAWAGGDVQFHVASTSAESVRALEILRKLHQARWQAAGRRGVFASAAFSAFHRRVIPALRARDAVELAWLSARGKPVAAAYNLVWNGKVYFYQSGRAMWLPRRLRPGIALHAHAIRHAIDRGRREYDFLGGASRYKRKLAVAARPIVCLRASDARSPLGRAQDALERGVSWARRLRDGGGSARAS